MNKFFRSIFSKPAASGAGPSRWSVFRIGAALAIFVVFVTLGLVGIQRLSTNYDVVRQNFVGSLSEWAGLPITSKSQNFKFNSVELTGVIFGDNNVLLDSVKVKFGFVPSSKASVMSLIESVDIAVTNLNLNHVLTLRSRFVQNDESSDHETNEPAIWRHLEKVMAIIVDKVNVDARIYIGRVCYTKAHKNSCAENVNLVYQKSSKLLTVALANPSIHDVAVEGQFSSRIKFSDNGERYNFNITQLGVGKRIPLTISGLVDLPSRTLNFSIDAEPPFLAQLPLLGRWIAKSKYAQHVFGRFEGVQKAENFVFNATANGERLRLSHELLNPEHALLPIDLAVRSNGVIDSAAITFEQVSLAVSRYHPKSKEGPQLPDADGNIKAIVPPLMAQGSGTISIAPHSTSVWTVAVPETPCVALSSLDSKYLTPLLKDFKVSGTLAFAAEFSRKGEDPFQMKLSQSDFNCDLSPKDKAQVITADRLAIANGIVTAFQKRSIYTRQFAPSTYVELAKIPQLVRRLFLASEDIAFYQHGGVDFAAMATALENNASEERRVLGGSTITMQLAKNIYLTPRRTIGRKIQEIFLSTYLEKHLSKDKILELYLNVAEFGPGVYGIAAASSLFFNKSVGSLSELEATYLAAVLPAPVRRYQYFCRRGLTDNMQNLVQQKFAQFHALGRIDDTAFAAGRQATVQFVAAGDAPYCGPGLTAEKNETEDERT